MKHTHIAGIDPGLVHSGLVSLYFEPEARRLDIMHWALSGPDVETARDIFRRGWPAWPDAIYIEGYRPRSNFGTDMEMVKAVEAFKNPLPRTEVLLNHGVKKVVRRPLMELLGCWTFSTPTHHQDLRSAARIALLGMLKNEETNRLLADIVRDHAEGRSWHVLHH